MRFRIIPTMSQCKFCMETAMSFNEEPQCCNCNTDVYEMLKLDKDYVYYIDKNELKKVHMNYVRVL